jgi:hypothetical protein
MLVNVIRFTGAFPHQSAEKPFGGGGSRRWAAFLLGCSLTVVAGPGLAVDRAPRVILDAPVDLAPAANHLRQWRPERLTGFQRLIGLSDAGEPIRVVLATEDSIPAAGAAPWIAGYARSDGLVVLFPARVPVYPYSSLDELLGHEVAHVLIARAARGRPVPRWFNEGLAMLAEEGWDWGDRSRAALALMRSQSYELADLDVRFRGSRSEVSAAYSLSASFVRGMVSRYGRDAPAEILRRIAGGEPFDAAFVTATGATLAEAEEAFWKRYAFWNRWVPFLGSSTTLWIAVTLLALLAILRRRARNRELEEKWAAEEGFDEGLPDEPVN